MLGGMRWGMALALFEIGLSAPVRWLEWQHWSQWLLLVFVPFGAYVFLGYVFGWLCGQIVARLKPSWVAYAWWGPGLFVIGLATADIWKNTATLSQSIFALIPLGLLGAAIALHPFFTKAPWDLRLYRLGWFTFFGAVFTSALWLWQERDPVLAATPAASLASDQYPNVVLITWDMVRADVLPLYGGRGIETPHLDRLADQSAVFEQMIAVAPITGPSHASLLTGVVPPSHGLRSNGNTRIADQVPTLAEQFRSAGYDTAAFVAAFPVKGKFGFHRGFRIYDDRLGNERLDELSRIGPREMVLLRWIRSRFLKRTTKTIPGDVVVQRAGEFVRDSQAPFFMWAHFFDAHGPHNPAEPYRLKAAALADDAYPRAADPEQSGRSMEGYRGEVMELDAYLGDLLAVLEQRDPGLQKTAIFLTSDHGHCFGEGGFVNTHVPSLLEATQHIPAVFRLPGTAAVRKAGSPEGAGPRRITELVSQVDVAATLADLAGVQPPANHQGVSLLPLARGQGGLPTRRWFADGLYMEAFQNRLSKPTDKRKVGIRTSEWKLFWEQGNLEALQLLRIAAAEDRNRFSEAPETARALQESLRATVDKLPFVDTRRTLSASDQEALQELGYAGDEEDEDAGTESDPHE